MLAPSGVQRTLQRKWGDGGFAGFCRSKKGGKSAVRCAGAPTGAGAKRYFDIVSVKETLHEDGWPQVGPPWTWAVPVRSSLTFIVTW